jgi:RHS repeat-associated protein
MKRAFAIVRTMVPALVALAGDVWAAGKPPDGAVTAETVKLPSGPGSIRGLADDPAVDPFSGQASYSIPLELPRGARGFTPPLSLSYHGELGNGPLGIGWDVGVPRIRRSTHQGVPSYTATDELELVGVSGGGRLVAISATEYRVEGDALGARVLVAGAGFQVWDRDGTRHDMGTGAASQLESAGKVAVWAVEKTVDVAGQEVRYGYLKDQGQLYLAQVSWGPDDAFAAVFELSARPDLVKSWLLGFSVTTARRVSAVRVESFGEVVRTYQLSYDEAFAVSRLERVRCVGRGGAEALPDVTFAYGQRAPAAAQPLTVGAWRLGATTVFMDVDGDGAADLVDLKSGSHTYRQNRGGSFAPPVSLTGASNISLATARLADVEGRARPNLIAQSGGFWQPYRIQGTAWVGLGQWQGTQNLPLSGANMTIADVNGDRRIDVVSWNAVGLQLRLGNAQGVSAAVAKPRIAGVLLPNASTRWHDLNGDGLVDVVQAGSASLVTYLGRGDGTFETGQSVAYPGGVPGPTDDLRFSDLDRDGLLDAIRISQAQVRRYGGRANGTFAAEPEVLPRPAGADSDSVVSIDDANGNGSEDVVWSSPAGMWALDLAGPTNAGMLVAVDNGMGKTLSIEYDATTALAGEDADAGQAWTWHLPMAVPVVVRTEVVTGPGELPRSVSYRVKNGFWDVSEHRFGGFLNASKIEANAGGEALEETRFHSGSGVQRVLRGRPVQVVRSMVVGGVKTTVESTTNTWRAMKLVGLPDLPLLRKAALDQTRSEFPEGQPAGAPLVTRIVYGHDAAGRVISEVHDGRLDLTDDDKRLERTWASDDATWVRDRLVEEKLSNGAGGLVSWTRTLYGDDDELLPLGQVGKGWARRVQGFLAEENRWVGLEEKDYDGLGNPVRSVQNGIERTLEWSDGGLFALAEHVVTGPTSELAWSLVWDEALGVPIQMTDPDGVVTRVTYDGLARPTSRALGTSPPHTVWRYGWNQPRPYTDSFTFEGALGAVTALPQPWVSGAGWRYTRAVANGAGEPLFSATRLGSGWIVGSWIERDARGREVFQGSAASWPGADLPASRPAGMAGVQVEYDPLGRKRREIGVNGEEILLTHRAFHQTVELVGLAPVDYDQDGLGRLRETRRESEVARIRRNPAGRIVAHEIGAGSALAHSYTYDTLGRLVGTASADEGARALSYNDAGRLLRVDNAAGQWAAFEYDGAGRRTAHRLDDGSAFLYHYSGGALVRIDEPSGRVDFEHDALGQVTRLRRVIDGVAGEERRVFSATGALVRLELDDAVAIDFERDDAGRVVRVGDLWEAESLDAAGLPLDERFGNDVRQVTGRDAGGRAIDIDVRAPGGSSLYAVGLTRNEWGATIGVDDRDGQGLDHDAAFTYDARARLTGASLAGLSLGFTYDDLQNMTARTASGPGAPGALFGVYRYGEAGTGPRQLSSIAPSVGAPATASFGWDAAGRQVSAGSRALSYNALDQLLRVDQGGQSVRHTYGHDGQRVRTIGLGGAVNRWFSGAIAERNGRREYLIQLDKRVIARIAAPLAPAATGSAAAGMTFLIGGALALALAMLHGRRRARARPRRRPAWAAATASLLVLALGCSGPIVSRSSAALTASETVYFHAGVAPGPVLFTGATGQVVEERRFDPFGQPLGQVSFADLDLGALNQPMDPDTGWSFHGARWLAPETARWTSIDPLGREPSEELAEQPWRLHPYQYVDQNPIHYWDPDGRSPSATDLIPFAKYLLGKGVGKTTATIHMPAIKALIKVYGDAEKVRSVRKEIDGFSAAASSFEQASRQLLNDVRSLPDDPLFEMGDRFVATQADLAAVRRYANAAAAMRDDAAALRTSIDDGIANYVKVKNIVHNAKGWGRKPMYDDWGFFQLRDNGQTERNLGDSWRMTERALDEAHNKWLHAKWVLGEAPAWYTPPSP